MKGVVNRREHGLHFYGICSFTLTLMKSTYQEVFLFCNKCFPAHSRSTGQHASCWETVLTCEQAGSPESSWLCCNLFFRNGRLQWFQWLHRHHCIDIVSNAITTLAHWPQQREQLQAARTLQRTAESPYRSCWWSPTWSRWDLACYVMFKHCWGRFVLNGSLRM